MMLKGELLYSHVFQTEQPVRDFLLVNAKSLWIFLQQYRHFLAMIDNLLHQHVLVSGFQTSSH